MQMQTKEQSFRQSSIYDENVAKFQGAIAFDNSNAGAHAALAETHFEAGELEAAIHHWRLAINAMPHGPHSRSWKTRLKGTLEMQQRLAQGLPARDFADFQICDSCRAEVPADSKSCPVCGTTLKMGFWEWTFKRENLRNIGRELWPIMAVLIVAAIVLSTFSFEATACVLMGAAIVAGIYFLRAIGG